MSEREQDILRAIPLRKPSGNLDNRMEKLLAAQRVRRPGLLSRAVPVWQLAAGCAVVAACAFLAGMFLQDGDEAAAARGEVRYVIQVEPAGFDVFDWTTYPKQVAPVSVLKARQPNAEKNSKSQRDMPSGEDQKVIKEEPWDLQI